MRATKSVIVILLISFASSVHAWSGKVFSVNGKNVTVATSDSSKARTGMVVYIVVDGKEVGRGRIGKAFHTKVEITLQSGRAQPGNIVTDVSPVAAIPVKKEEPKKDPGPLPDKMAAAAFFDFCGISHGDTRDKVLRLFGKAEETQDESNNKYDFTSSFWFQHKFRITIFKDSAKESRKTRVQTIAVESAEAAAKIRGLGINDPKLDLWGVHVDEIKKRFGEPNRVSSGNYEYHYDAGDRSGHVTFVCYDFWQNQCKEIRVQWFYR